MIIKKIVTLHISSDERHLNEVVRSNFFNEDMRSHLAVLLTPSILRIGTYEQSAKVLGMTPSMVSNIVNGHVRTGFSLERLLSCFVVLGLDFHMDIDVKSE